MFDPIPWRGQMCDRHLLALDGEEEDLDDWDDPEERYYREEIDDDEGPLADLARLAVDIEAGRAEVPNRWKLDRPSPGILVWTTPPNDMPWGQRVGHIQDPDGNTVNLTEPIQAGFLSRCHAPGSVVVLPTRGGWRTSRLARTGEPIVIYFGSDPRHARISR